MTDKLTDDQLREGPMAVEGAPDFVEVLQGWASMIERGATDVEDHPYLVANLRDACFVIDQLQKHAVALRASLESLHGAHRALNSACNNWSSHALALDMEIRALRAERAKPTQSDEERARDIILAHFRISLSEGEAKFVIRDIISLCASIRAEGSAERAKLEAALRKYGHHDGLCNTRSNRFEDCNCGFDAALTMGASV